MILVFIEHKDGALNRASLEAVAAAQSIGRDLGLKVSAVIPTDNAGELADKIAGYELEKVFVVASPNLGNYTPDAYTDAFEAVMNETNPQFVVMAHTYQVRD